MFSYFFSTTILYRQSKYYSVIQPDQVYVLERFVAECIYNLIKFTSLSIFNDSQWNMFLIIIDRMIMVFRIFIICKGFIMPLSEEIVMVEMDSGDGNTCDIDKKFEKANDVNPL